MTPGVEPAPNHSGGTAGRIEEAHKAGRKTATYAMGTGGNPHRKQGRDFASSMAFKHMNEEAHSMKRSWRPFHPHASASTTSWTKASRQDFALCREDPARETPSLEQRSAWPGAPRHAAARMRPRSMSTAGMWKRCFSLWTKGIQLRTRSGRDLHCSERARC